MGLILVSQRDAIILPVMSKELDTFRYIARHAPWINYSRMTNAEYTVMVSVACEEQHHRTTARKAAARTLAGLLRRWGVHRNVRPLILTHLKRFPSCAYPNLDIASGSPVADDDIWASELMNR